MRYLDYHGFEATIGLSTGRNGTQTSNMVRFRTGCLLANQGIPPSYSFKLLRSWTFFRYFHPVPRKPVQLEILPHIPRNTSTYTRRHTSSTVLTCTMSPKRKMVSPMRGAAIWRLSTFRCRNSEEGSVELISRGISRCAHWKYKGHLRPIAFMSRKMQPAETRYPIPEQQLLAIVLALRQWFHLLRGPQQVHVHTDHKTLRYLKTCSQPLTQQQTRWSQIIKEYNLTLWYVPGLENPAADACSRLTSQQLMDIENATRTRAFAIPLVENWASLEEEPVDEFLLVIED